MIKVSTAIEYLMRINEFAKKGYKLPFIVRRAIENNRENLIKEYKIFDEARKDHVEGYEEKTDEEKAEIDSIVQEMLDTKIELKIEKFSVYELKNVDMDLIDEDLIKFMFDESKEETEKAAQ